MSKNSGGKLVIAGIAIVLFLALGGGLWYLFSDRTPKLSEGSVAPPEHPMQAETVPEKIPVDIYWDATYSMQGYTTLSAGNLYRTLPAHLGDIGDAMGGVKFFRFGETVRPLAGREHLRFADASYYDEVITATHRAIDAADPKHLSVIVTDLFESDADWSNVTQKLKEKFFAQHHAVALIGIRNSFKGDVFDVGLNAAKYFYDSGNDPTKFRPFYMLVMGPDPKVRDFIERWRERQQGPNETHYLLLSEILMDKEGDFTNLKQKAATNLFPDERLAIKDRRIREFGIDSYGDPASLTVDFQYQPAFGACPLDMNTLQSEVELYALSESGEWATVDRDEKATATIQENVEQPGEYEVVVSLTPETCLMPDQINFLHVAIVPKGKSFKLPDWVKAWNMSNVDVSPDYFDGSKTVNLKHIAESLKDSALSAAKPRLVHLDMVFVGK